MRPIRTALVAVLLLAAATAVAHAERLRSATMGVSVMVRSSCRVSANVEAPATPACGAISTVTITDSTGRHFLQVVF